MLQLLSFQSRWACWCVGVLVWFGLSLPVQAQEKRLLFFGNSFSLGGGGIHLNVHDLAVASGYDAPVVVGDLAGGQDLDYHLGQVNSYPQNNVDHASLAAGETWDAIVVQGYSTEATATQGDGTFVSDVLALQQAISSDTSGHGGGASVVLFQTWARGYGHSYYPGLYTSPQAMQSEIVSGYDAAQTALVGQGVDATIAPIGEAFASTGFDSSLYGSDIYHASNPGYLLAAMVMYRTLYDGSLVSEIAYSDLTSRVRGLASESSWLELVAVADAVAVPEPTTLVWCGLVGAMMLARGAARRGRGVRK